ncbi:MAG: hypothetical protein Q4B58_02980 [Bacteroidales bacterium]|nr:hypothetical protein [Bacteroidales bacterium]
MKHQNIDNFDQLLDSFCQGKSSPEEEAKLMAELEREAEMHVPMGFEQRLQATLSRLEASEAAVAPVSEPVLVAPRSWAQRHGRLMAACLTCLVVVSAAIGFLSRTEPDPFADTCATAEQAEYQLNRALTLVSTFSQASLETARIEAGEAQHHQQPVSKFISFD